MKTKRFTILLLTILLAAPAFAQTIVSGSIRDESGEPLPGARVYLQDTYDGATTDTAGQFRISTTEKGNFVLKAEFMEYAPFAAPVQLNGEPVELDIRLKEAFSEVKAVTISAGAFEASDRKQAVILNSIDMVTTAGSTGDVYGALQSLPGTSTVGESGRLFVRGGSGRETQTFIDGNWVARPFSASPPNLSVRGRFNPFMFKGTVFSTGGYSAEYGQALSSVLQLETNELPAEDQLDIGLLNLGGDLSGTKTWKNGAVTGSASYFNLGPYMGIVPQFMNWNKAPESMGGQFNLRQETGRSGMFKLYGNYNRAAMDLNQELPGGGNTSYDLTNSNLFLNSSWKTVLNDKWGMRIGASFTRNRDLVGLENGDFEEDLTAGHGKVAMTYAPSQKIKVRFGGEFFAQQYGMGFEEGTDSIAMGWNERRGAGFVEADLYASQKLVFRVGGRTDYSAYLDQWNVAPRIAAAYKLTDHAQVSLAYGIFTQAPEEQVLLYTDQLRAERADHYLANFQYHKDGRSFRAETYFKDYRSLVTFTDAPFFLPEAYANDGEGYAYGLDLFYRDRKTVKNGDFWISYSFMQTERLHRDFPEMAVPGFASTHNLSVVYKHFISNWRSLPGATFSYGSPRRYNDPNTPEFNAERMPAFLSLDLNWTYLHRENVIFHFAVNNAPGFRQQFGYRYADSPDANGEFASVAIRPAARRMFIIGCFITLSRNDKNQLDKIN
jgi:hypothetical protein